MSAPKLRGGSTQDEVLAVSLSKLGLQTGDRMLDLGCGTGKVSIAASRIALHVCAIDRRAEAVRHAKKEAARACAGNIEFFCAEAEEFLASRDQMFDCAFVGGSYRLADVLPLLAPRVRRRIVVNAVLVSTLGTTVSKMQELGIFREAVYVQVARSHGIAGSIMFSPIDPVYVIVGEGKAC
jgi:cobalt-precorrin-6B (C15)-methyltransferase